MDSLILKIKKLKVKNPYRDTFCTGRNQTINEIINIIKYHQYVTKTSRKN